MDQVCMYLLQVVAEDDDEDWHLGAVEQLV